MMWSSFPCGVSSSDRRTAPGSRSPISWLIRSFRNRIASVPPNQTSSGAEGAKWGSVGLIQMVAMSRRNGIERRRSENQLDRVPTLPVTMTTPKRVSSSPEAMLIGRR